MSTEIEEFPCEYGMLPWVSSADAIPAPVVLNVVGVKVYEEAMLALASQCWGKPRSLNVPLKEHAEGSVTLELRPWQ